MPAKQLAGPGGNAAQGRRDDEKSPLLADGASRTEARLPPPAAKRGAAAAAGSSAAGPGVPSRLVSYDELLPLLPPLEERACAYWQEAACGAVVVFTIILSLNAFAHAASPTGTTVQWLMWLWTAIAVGCWAWVVAGDAGEVTRSAQNCLPVPDRVAEHLARRGEPPKSNVEEAEGTYCIRCYVWRRRRDIPDDWRGGSYYHHCSVCQRCVRGFDHHCGVLGRCIAERNYSTFVGLLWMAGAGMLTSFAGGLLTSAPDGMQGAR